MCSARLPNAQRSSHCLSYLVRLQDAYPFEAVLEHSNFNLVFKISNSLFSKHSVENGSESNGKKKLEQKYTRCSTVRSTEQGRQKKNMLSLLSVTMDFYPELVVFIKRWSLEKDEYSATKFLLPVPINKSKYR